MIEQNEAGHSHQESPMSVLSELPDFDTHMEAMSQSPESPQVQNLNKLVDFFDRDESVKRTLLDIAPLDTADEAAYSDTLYQGFTDIKSDFQAMMADYYPSEDFDARLSAISDDIINNPHRLPDVYRRDFSDLREDFVTAVHDETVGYTFRNPHSLDNKAVSINEMLHLMHQSVLNNEDILQSLPAISKNSTGDVLYGDPTEESLAPEPQNPEQDSEPAEPAIRDIAEQILAGLENDPESGETSIVALKDRILMMIRDRAHATTINITKDPDDKYYVDYFLPKICNVDKVNLLPGVRQVEKRPGERQVQDSTTGVFSISDPNSVASDVLDFISRIPTDSDIPSLF